MLSVSLFSDMAVPAEALHGSAISPVFCGGAGVSAEKARPALHRLYQPLTSRVLCHIAAMMIRVLVQTCCSMQVWEI